MELDFEFKESGLCGRLCTFLHTKVFPLIVHMFFTTHIFVGEYCVQVFKIVCSFSTFKLLAHSCVGVLDMHDQCAVVTLVVSNCMK